MIHRPFPGGIHGLIVRPPGHPTTLHGGDNALTTPVGGGIDHVVRNWMGSGTKIPFNKDNLRLSLIAPGVVPQVFTQPSSGSPDVATGPLAGASEDVTGYSFWTFSGTTSADVPFTATAIANRQVYFSLELNTAGSWPGTEIARIEFADMDPAITSPSWPAATRVTLFWVLRPCYASRSNPTDASGAMDYERAESGTPGANNGLAVADASLKRLSGIAAGRITDNIGQCDIRFFGPGSAATVSQYANWMRLKSLGGLTNQAVAHAHRGGATILDIGPFTLPRLSDARGFLAGSDVPLYVAGRTHGYCAMAGTSRSILLGARVVTGSIPSSDQANFTATVEVAPTC